MIGLIKKDIILIVKNASVVYLIAIVIPVLVALQNLQYLLPIITMSVAFLFALQVTTTMSFDENVKWRKNVTAMPIPAFYEASGKYVLTLILAICSSVIILMIGVVLETIFSAATRNMILMYTFFCFCIVLLYNVIIIPASYKYGTAKSRYFLMLFMMIPISIPYLIKAFNIDMSIKVVANVFSPLILIRLTAMLLILLGISLLLSTRVLKNSK